MRFILLFFMVFFSCSSFGQSNSHRAAKKWADSVYNGLNPDERIGQLIITRLSSIDTKTKKITSLFDQVVNYIDNYNIGGICIFQGSPLLQAQYLNQLKKRARTPLLVSIDGEWGVGMRITDSVTPLPKQMMLGAIKKESIIYEYGKTVAEQCKRLGIQMNYAPVMDVNNNPNNPVINDRSFGENKYVVAKYGSLYMKGMQDNGVMGCAKHFPGHGDVAVDSHLDLPIINKTYEQLDSVELFPFKKIFEAGVGSVMVGHLSIPSIDNRNNRPTSLSEKNIQGLLKNKLGYNGLVITDGLEMQGVKKFFPNGEASVEALIAGNDLLCLPDSIPMVVEKIKQALIDGRLTWSDIEKKCKKVLLAKYNYVLLQNDSICYNNLTIDLNKNAIRIKTLVAKNAITLVSNEDPSFFPLQNTSDKKTVAYIGIGISIENVFAREIKNKFSADVFLFDFNKKNTDSINNIIKIISSNYDKIIIGIHQINRSPANNFGISSESISFIDSVIQKKLAILFLFGNAYALKNWCGFKNAVVCYEDDSTTQKIAAQMLAGKLPYKGRLPVSVCEQYKFGHGLSAHQRTQNQSNIPKHYKDSDFKTIDSIVQEAIIEKAMPGCAILVAKNNEIIYKKSYGYYTYDQKEAVQNKSLYDLASLTKILSTTLCIMKLYDEEKINLTNKLGDYLPFTKGTDKEHITIEQLLLHEAGLLAFFPYYKETLDENGSPLKKYYKSTNKKGKMICVADKLYIKQDCLDSFYHKIVNSPVSLEKNYVYSDLDFIFLGSVIEKITGMRLNDYVSKTFYIPMGLEKIGYLPKERFSKKEMVPTVLETTFRKQEVRGFVHDQSAAIMGGVAGHAGLFSNTEDVFTILQMLLNKGEWNGKKYLKKETIELFTDYQSENSRRGLGFDKPYRDNATSEVPYPAKSCSEETFGHSGFTGTCAWADPANDLIFIFLSNRTYPEDNNVFKKINIRPKILEAIYEALKK